jgi:hypothetical protein
MFWDSILDPMRNFVSNDVTHWMVAAALVTVLITRSTALASGSLEMRQELQFGAAVFIVLAGVFYLP